MNEFIRLRRVANKLPLFAASILRNYIRIYGFEDCDYIKMEQRRIKTLDNQGIDQPIWAFDESSGITWDGQHVPYSILVNVIFEEVYRFEYLHVTLKFITHIRKNSYVRSTVFMQDGEEKIVAGSPTTKLFFLYDPFIRYKTMSTLCRNLDKDGILYNIEYREFSGMILKVYHNERHTELRTLFGDRSHKLVMVDRKEDLAMTATDALRYIKRKH